MNTHSLLTYCIFFKDIMLSTILDLSIIMKAKMNYYI